MEKRTDREIGSFGLVNAIMLGGILFAGFILGLVLTFPVGDATLAGTIGKSTQHLAWFPFALLLIELCVYAGVAATQDLRGKLLVFAVIAIGTRLVVTFLLAMFFHGKLAPSVLGAVTAKYAAFWPYHLLAMIMTAALMATALRTLVSRGLSRPAEPAPKRPVKAQFSFKMERDLSRANASGSAQSAASPQDPEPGTQLAPPEGFTQVRPNEDILGLVTIPHDLLYEAIPEAKRIIEPSRPVRIRLSYLAPQIREATAWLTWQQVFPNSPENPNSQHAKATAETALHGRWIRIPARYFVPHIPQEFFVRQNTSQPQWMKMQPVAQEAQLEIR